MGNTTMDYEKALAWVHGLKRFALAPGLERMRKLMAALWNPQRQLRFVHVAGTKGKGSVTTMLASAIKAAGYTVGLNVSPYVVDFRERFQIGGEMISETRLAKVLSEVRCAAEALGEPVIEFEAVTAAALLYFAQERCDLVCLEAGLGGRLDSTNIVENTLVACVARIGLDHTAILGGTVAEIAAEKCGIFKPGCQVVCYPRQPAEALRVIRQQAAEKQCALTVADVPERMDQVGDSGLSIYRYKSVRFELPAAGEHQALNAAVAAEATWALRGHGYVISDAHIAQGIRAARIPARIEFLRRHPPVIVDSAHNVDSAEALAAFLKEAGFSNLTAVAGMLDDKDSESVLDLVAPYIGRLYTAQPDSLRALPAAVLADRARKSGGFAAVTACKSIDTAIKMALEDGGSGLLVFGSFYLAANARKILSNNSNFKA